MAITPIAQIHVTSKTTLEDLQKFADEASTKDGAKLRAKSDGKDGYILYAVDRSSSLISRITGKARQRRDDARFALTQILANNHDKSKTPVGSLMKLVHLDVARSPTATSLRQLMTMTGNKSEAIGLHERENVVKANAPVKEQFVAPELMLARQEIVEIAREVKEGKTLLTDAAFRILELVEPNLNTGSSLAKAELVGTGIGAGIAKIMSEVLTEQDPRELKQNFSLIGDEVGKAISELLLNSKMKSDTSFVLDGVTYNKVRDLGEGAFGAAALFVSEGGQEVVLKKPLSISPSFTSQQLAASSREEFVKHKSMQESLPEGGHPNLLKLVGGVPLPGGGIGIVTEAAKGGDLTDSLHKIDQAVKDDRISPENARVIKLTLLQDMLKGLASIHEAGLMHRDFKVQNVFMSGDGVGKVADFGTMLEGRSYESTYVTDVDAPHFLPPEEHRKREDIGSYGKEVETFNQSLDKSLETAALALWGEGGLFANYSEYLGGESSYEGFEKSPIFGEEFKIAMKELRSQIMIEEYKDKDVLSVDNTLGGQERRMGWTEGQSVLERQIGEIDSGPGPRMMQTEPYDVWALGIAALNMFVTERPFVTNFDFNITSHLADWATNGTRALGPGSDLGVTIDDKRVRTTRELTSGDDVLDGFINKMLAPDPGDRPSFDDLLRDPIFSSGGVGSTEARNLMTGLLNNVGDMTGLNQALAQKL